MIPGNTYLPLDPTLMRNKIMDDYQLTANFVNGRLESWTPTVYGSTTSGSLTYTTQDGWYYSQGIMTDIWFNVVWSAVGGAVGSILMDMPVISQFGSSDIAVTSIHTTSLSFSVNYTYATLVMSQNSNIASIFECGSAQTAQNLTFAVSGTGGFQGHIRYIGQRDLSRR